MSVSLLHQIEAAEAEHLTLYGGEVARFGAVRAVYAGPDLPVNVAAGFGTSLNGLDDTETFYAAHTLPSRLVLYSHFPHWETVAARGYRLARLLNIYARPLEGATAPPALTVRPSPPAEFARLTAEAFGPGNEEIMERTSQRSKTLLLAAELDGEPVAAGALSVFGEVALLFSTAALPAFRGRGAQTALLAARLHAARDGGTRWAAVMTTPGSASERNVLRAGFTLAGTRLSLAQA